MLFEVSTTVQWKKVNNINLAVPPRTIITYTSISTSMTNYFPHSQPDPQYRSKTVTAIGEGEQHISNAHASCEAKLSCMTASTWYNNDDNYGVAPQTLLQHQQHKSEGYIPVNVRGNWAILPVSRLSRHFFLNWRTLACVNCHAVALIEMRSMNAITKTPQSWPLRNGTTMQTVSHGSWQVQLCRGRQ